MQFFKLVLVVCTPGVVLPNSSLIMDKSLASYQMHTQIHQGYIIYWHQISKAT
jgi:hypothetical protein